MNNEIEKPESPSPDDILAAIQSFNDPGIITNIFRELGWSYSLEIKETLIMAKQNANLSIKFKANKHLRELLREAAETSGYTANVSQTFPNAQGGHTTFQAKRLANMLNPTKQIEATIKEPENDVIQKQQIEETRTEPDRDGDRQESQDTERHTADNENRSVQKNGQDTGRAFPAGDGDVGGTESRDGGEIPRPVPRESGVNNSHSSESPDITPDDNDSQESNPCIKTRPPTCDRELFPGISSADG